MTCLQELYRLRAEYAKLESDVQDFQKYVTYNGIFWLILEWVRNSAASDRLDIQAEIDKLLGKSYD